MLQTGRHADCKVTPLMGFLDVSVVMAFKDHEHLVGKASRRIAEHFRAAGLTFEIIALDQGSGDNSQPVLQLLRSELSELRIITGRTYGAGARVATAPVLVLLTPEQAADGLTASCTAAVREIASRHLDMKLVDENLLVCAAGCTDLIASAASGRRQIERKLLERGQARGLSVRSYGPDAPRSHARRISQVLRAVVPLGGGLHRVR